MKLISPEYNDDGEKVEEKTERSQQQQLKSKVCGGFVPFLAVINMRNFFQSRKILIDAFLSSVSAEKNSTIFQLQCAVCITTFLHLVYHMIPCNNVAQQPISQTDYCKSTNKIKPSSSICDLVIPRPVSFFFLSSTSYSTRVSPD